jgi:hypothetical protein
MKRISIVVAFVCFVCIFVVRTGGQNKQKSAPPQMSSVEVAPAVVCTAPGMAKAEDAASARNARPNPRTPGFERTAVRGREIFQCSRDGRRVSPNSRTPEAGHASGRRCI